MVSLIPKGTAPKIAPTTTKNTSLFSEKSILIVATSLVGVVSIIIAIVFALPFFIHNELSS
jgi:hypothetical protein